MDFPTTQQSIAKLQCQTRKNTQFGNLFFIYLWPDGGARVKVMGSPLPLGNMNVLSKLNKDPAISY